MLAADVGHGLVDVILSPADLRAGSLPETTTPVRPWVPELYENIRSALSRLPLPPHGA